MKHFERGLAVLEDFPAGKMRIKAFDDVEDETDDDGGSGRRRTEDLPAVAQLVDQRLPLQKVTLISSVAQVLLRDDT